MMEHSRRKRQAVIPLRTPEEIVDALRAVLEAAPVSLEERIQVLASALVVEALQPHWGRGRSAADAHAALRRQDPELADTIEAIAPMLLARLESRQEAEQAVRMVESLLGVGS